MRRVARAIAARDAWCVWRAEREAMQARETGRARAEALLLLLPPGSLRPQRAKKSFTLLTRSRIKNGIFHARRIFPI